MKQKANAAGRGAVLLSLKACFPVHAGDLVARLYHVFTRIAVEIWHAELKATLCEHASFGLL